MVNRNQLKCHLRDKFLPQESKSVKIINFMKSLIT